MCTGAVARPSCRAASSRVCPARITIVLVDDDRLPPAELLQRGRHRRHRGRVLPRVAGIGDQPLERQVDDVHRRIRGDAGRAGPETKRPRRMAGPKPNRRPAKRNAFCGPFRFGRCSGWPRAKLAWPVARSETKWPILPMSLGKPCAQPPGIQFAPGRTREFSLLPRSSVGASGGGACSIAPLPIMPRT